MIKIVEWRTRLRLLWWAVILGWMPTSFIFEHDAFEGGVQHTHRTTLTKLIEDWERGIDDSPRDTT